MVPVYFILLLLWQVLMKSQSKVMDLWVLVKLQVILKRKGAASELVLPGNLLAFKVQGLPLVSEPMLDLDLYVEGLQRGCLAEPGLKPDPLSLVMVLRLIELELIAAIEAVVLIKTSKVLFLEQSQH